MLDLQEQITSKIITTIQNNGIPSYLSKWNPKYTIRSSTSKKQFINNLNKFVKSYHPHSSIFVNEKKLVSVNEKKLVSKKNHKKIPSFYYDSKSKIGRIVYYEYFLDFNDKFEKSKQFIQLVEIVHKTLTKWHIDGLLGLIIDLRNHTGGWFVPFVYSLSSFLENTTLFAWSNTKAMPSSKTWISYVNNSIKYQTKLLKDIKLNIPIAVIIGNKTYSSGEFCASIFYRNNSKIKIFGQRTGGGLSVNMTFDITDDIKLNIPLQLVTTVDRHFHIKQYLQPNNKTTTPVKDAKLWIKSYKS